MMDAAFASLAMFSVGIYATRVFDAATLGIYAIVFTAFLFASVLPTQLILVPSEIAALQQPRGSRLGLLSRSIAMVSPLSLVAAAIVPVMAVLIPAEVPTSTVVALGSTASVATLVSPIQDHVRRLLHLSGRSWKAAVVSVAQFVFVLAALGTMSWLGVPKVWIVFGSLAAANTLSMSVGLVLSRSKSRLHWAKELSFALLVRSGRWLLVAGAVPAAAAFVATWLVVLLAGPEAAGFAEAARVVGQPILVLALGLTAVLRPRSMEAAAAKSRREARRIEVGFLLFLSAATALYFLAVGRSWPWNPLPELLPNAYAVNGLIGLTIVVGWLNGGVLPSRSELLGGRKEASMAGVEIVGSGLRVGVAGAAGQLGAWALPWGGLVLGVTRWLGFHRAKVSVYRTSESGGPTDQVPSG
jgi:O-antigen/teichoic acid export membrane protein